MTLQRCVLGLALWVSGCAAFADEALVAVATNFVEVLKELEARFEAETGHQLVVISGATGKLYAQVRSGAPFDVLLAADQARPEQLARDREVVPGSRFTYALGRLTLWSPVAQRIPSDGAQFLREGEFRRLAIANPALAPYGEAARQALTALGLWEGLRPRIVMGENIGQTHAMVATGNAEAGFVALSSVQSHLSGSRWDVPLDLYAPIRQDAVLLRHGRDNAAAQAFLRYLKRDDVRLVIESYGYGTGDLGG